MRLKTLNAKQEFLATFSGICQDPQLLEEIFKKPRVQKYILNEKLPPSVLVEQLCQPKKKASKQQVAKLIEDESSSSSEEDKKNRVDNRLLSLLGLDTVRSKNSLLATLKEFLDELRCLKAQVSRIENAILSGESNIKRARPTASLFENLYLSEQEKGAIQKSLLSLLYLIATVDSWPQNNSIIKDVSDAIQSVDIHLRDGFVDKCIKQGLVIEGKHCRILDFKIIDKTQEKDQATLARIEQNTRRSFLSMGTKESVVVLRSSVQQRADGFFCEVRVFVDLEQYQANFDRFKVKSSDSVYSNVFNDQIISFSNLDRQDNYKKVRQDWRSMKTAEKSFLILEALHAYCHIYTMFKNSDSDYNHSSEIFQAAWNSIVPFNVFTPY